MKNTGYIKSVLDGTELVVDNLVKKASLKMPKTYEYGKFIKGLRRVKDQGSTSMCVAYSLSYVLEAMEYMADNDTKFQLDKNEIYGIRQDKKRDGMQIKEALAYAKKHGYSVSKKSKEVHKIRNYGLLKSVEAIKRSILMNGPCIFALPVANSNNEHFWDGSQIIGGHAVACIGYNEEGFTIINSWGSSWGDGGYTTLPYNETNKLLEAWAIIK